MMSNGGFARLGRHASFTSDPTAELSGFGLRSNGELTWCSLVKIFLSTESISSSLPQARDAIDVIDTWSMVSAATSCSSLP